MSTKPVTKPVTKPTTEPDAPDAPAPKAKAKKVFIVSVNGPLRHQFTNDLFTCDPKPVEIDSFIQAQLDAGKLAIFDADA